jgi:hypothetical protein
MGNATPALSFPVWKESEGGGDSAIHNFFIYPTGPCRPDFQDYGQAKFPASPKARFHSPRGTGFDTELTGAALGRIKNNLHGLAVDEKGTGGADGCAGSAVDAFLLHPGNILLDGLDPDAHLRQVFHPLLEIRLRTAELQNHETLLSGQDAGLEDVETQVEILDQPVNNRLVPVFFGKMKYNLLGSHNSSPRYPQLKLLYLSDFVNFFPFLTSFPFGDVQEHKKTLTTVSQRSIYKHLLRSGKILIVNAKRLKIF